MPKKAAVMNRKDYTNILCLGIFGIWSGLLSVAYADADLPIQLGEYPLCEASAAAIVDCPGSSETCLLVGDNEVRDRLFLFGVTGQGERAKLGQQDEIRISTLPHPGGGELELSDIEAIVRLSRKEVVVFGSHSRNSQCDRKKKRRIFAQGNLTVGRLAKSAMNPIGSKKHKCKRLFGDRMDTVMQRVCDAIERSEDSAEMAFEKEDKAERINACNLDPAFNIEGAVAVGETAEIWIGLRAPLVDDKAVLLRQVPGEDHLKFDAAAFVDLGKSGIRDLTYEQNRVWAISGPPIDGDASHGLWRMNASELEHGAVIQPEYIFELPNRAEGLAITNGTAFVVIDGNEAKKGETNCRMNSSIVIRKIPS